MSFERSDSSSEHLSPSRNIDKANFLLQKSCLPDPRTDGHLMQPQAVRCCCGEPCSLLSISTALFFSLRTQTIEDSLNRLLTL